MVVLAGIAIDSFIVAGGQLAARRAGFTQK
jgi:ABC-type uncharacterized transport system involved in gliding motility auxiliary subunit